MEIGLTDEDLPNERSDDVESAISGISDSERPGPHVVTVAGIPPNVLVTTTSNLISDTETLRAARIIIHDPSTLNALNGTQTVTFNPLNRSLSVPEKNFSWDPSVYDPVLPIRCRNVKGELHKNRFGSGNRGRSILFNGQWCTPSEFEAACGRANSKDWKRSIRYAGRSLMCLINEGILRPHATSCTCGTCCDDNTVDSTDIPVSTTGPVRLFTPYKRRKRQMNPKLKVSTNVQLSNTENVASAPIELQSTESLTTNGNIVPFVTLDTNTPSLPESVIVTPVATPQTPRCAPTVIDFSEQKQWWQLEEMVKNAVRQITDLQKQVEAVKNESAAAREAALKQLRIQMESERKEAINACRLEAQVALSKALIQAKKEKEAAVEKALQQERLSNSDKMTSVVISKLESKNTCANCDREAFSECTGCHKVFYCGSFCQQKDWKQHQEECSDGILNTENCSSLVNDCEDPTS